MVRVLVVIGVLLALGTVARAQPIATDPDPTPAPAVSRRRDPHPPAGLGVGLAFGWGGQRNGPDGWVARLDYEALPVFTDRGLFGFQVGFEAWRSGKDNWGGSMPLAIVLGVRERPVRATIGFGFDAFLVDQVADDTGVGLFAPFAMAKAGLDIHGFQLGADARIGYRWQIGADDHTRWQLGLFVAATFDTGWHRRPRY